MPQTSNFTGEAVSHRKASFYFAAHPDDWQLFMNPSAFEDVADSTTKAVFVHLTSGDAGLGLGTGGRMHPLYLARENGAEAAIRFMADVDRAPVARIAAPIQFDGHAIHRVNYKMTASYFLRLPDGNPAGTGYPETGHQSLPRLARGDIEACSAIDGSTVYRGWSDLVSTLRQVMVAERGSAPTLELHVPEPDRSINPGDHPDHFATAKAALDAASGLADVRRLLHVGYASAALPENLTPQQRDIKCAVYAVTVAGLLAFDHGVAWRRYDHAYVGRSHFRVVEGATIADDAVDGVLTDAR